MAELGAGFTFPRESRTLTVTETVADALEMEHVESHLHPAASYDLADHPVPTGREEIWRFTPLKRLRGMLDGAESDAQAGRLKPRCPRASPRRVAIASAEARGLAGCAPNDRLGRAGRGRRAGGCLLLDVPAEAELDGPVLVDAHTATSSTTWSGATCGQGRCPRPCDARARPHRLRHVRRAPPSRRRRRRPADLVASTTGPTTPCTSAASHPGRPRRDAQARRVSPSAATSCGCTPTSTTPVRAGPPSCSASTSPTPASTSSTGCSSTTPPRGPRATSVYKGALQGEGPTRSGSATC